MQVLHRVPCFVSKWRKILWMMSQWTKQLVMCYPPPKEVKYIVVHKRKLYAFYVIHFTVSNNAKLEHKPFGKLNMSYILNTIRKQCPQRMLSWRVLTGMLPSMFSAYSGWSFSKVLCLKEWNCVLFITYFAL